MFTQFIPSILWYTPSHKKNRQRCRHHVLSLPSLCAQGKVKEFRHTVIGAHFPSPTTRAIAALSVCLGLLAGIVTMWHVKQIFDSLRFRNRYPPTGYRGTIL